MATVRNGNVRKDKIKESWSLKCKEKQIGTQVQKTKVNRHQTCSDRERKIKRERERIERLREKEEGRECDQYLNKVQKGEVKQSDR